MKLRRMISHPKKFFHELFNGPKQAPTQPQINQLELQILEEQAKIRKAQEELERQYQQQLTLLKENGKKITEEAISSYKSLNASDKKIALDAKDQFIAQRTKVDLHKGKTLDGQKLFQSSAHSGKHLRKKTLWTEPSSEFHNEDELFIDSAQLEEVEQILNKTEIEKLINLLNTEQDIPISDLIEISDEVGLSDLTAKLRNLEKVVPKNEKAQEEQAEPQRAHKVNLSESELTEFHSYCIQEPELLIAQLVEIAESILNQVLIMDKIIHPHQRTNCLIQGYSLAWIALEEALKNLKVKPVSIEASEFLIRFVLKTGIIRKYENITIDFESHSHSQSQSLQTQMAIYQHAPWLYIFQEETDKIDPIVSLLLLLEKCSHGKISREYLAQLQKELKELKEIKEQKELKENKNKNKNNNININEDNLPNMQSIEIALDSILQDMDASEHILLENFELLYAYRNVLASKSFAIADPKNLEKAKSLQQKALNDEVTPIDTCLPSVIPSWQSHKFKFKKTNTNWNVTLKSPARLSNAKNIHASFQTVLKNVVNHLETIGCKVILEGLDYDEFEKKIVHEAAEREAERKALSVQKDAKLKSNKDSNAQSEEILDEAFNDESINKEIGALIIECWSDELKPRYQSQTIYVEDTSILESPIALSYRADETIKLTLKEPLSGKVTVNHPKTRVTKDIVFNDTYHIDLNLNELFNELFPADHSINEFFDGNFKEFFDRDCGAVFNSEALLNYNSNSTVHSIYSNKFNYVEDNFEIILTLKDSQWVEKYPIEILPPKNQKLSDPTLQSVPRLYSESTDFAHLFFVGDRPISIINKANQLHFIDEDSVKPYASETLSKQYSESLKYIQGLIKSDNLNESVAKALLVAEKLLPYSPVFATSFIALSLLKSESSAPVDPVRHYLDDSQIQKFLNLFFQQVTLFELSTQHGVQKVSEFIAACQSEFQKDDLSLPAHYAQIFSDIHSEALETSLKGFFHLVLQTQLLLHTNQFTDPLSENALNIFQNLELDPKNIISLTLSLFELLDENEPHFHLLKQELKPILHSQIKNLESTKKSLIQRWGLDECVFFDQLNDLHERFEFANSVETKHLQNKIIEIGNEFNQLRSHLMTYVNETSDQFIQLSEALKRQQDSLEEAYLKDKKILQEAEQQTRIALAELRAQQKVHALKMEEMRKKAQRKQKMSLIKNIVALAISSFIAPYLATALIGNIGAFTQLATAVAKGAISSGIQSLISGGKALQDALKGGFLAAAGQMVGSLTKTLQQEKLINLSPLQNAAVQATATAMVQTTVNHGKLLENMLGSAAGATLGNLALGLPPEVEHAGSTKGSVASAMGSASLKAHVFLKDSARAFIQAGVTSAVKKKHLQPSGILYDAIGAIVGNVAGHYGQALAHQYQEQRALRERAARVRQADVQPLPLAMEQRLQQRLQEDKLANERKYLEERRSRQGRGLRKVGRLNKEKGVKQARHSKHSSMHAHVKGKHVPFAGNSPNPGGNGMYAHDNILDKFGADIFANDNVIYEITDGADTSERFNLSSQKWTVLYNQNRPARAAKNKNSSASLVKKQSHNKGFLMSVLDTIIPPVHAETLEQAAPTIKKQKGIPNALERRDAILREIHGEYYIPESSEAAIVLGGIFGITKDAADLAVDTGKGIGTVAQSTGILVSEKTKLEARQKIGDFKNGIWHAATHPDETSKNIQEFFKLKLDDCTKKFAQGSYFDLGADVGTFALVANPKAMYSTGKGLFGLGKNIAKVPSRGYEWLKFRDLRGAFKDIIVLSNSSGGKFSLRNSACEMAAYAIPKQTILTNVTSNIKSLITFQFRNALKCGNSVGAALRIEYEAAPYHGKMNYGKKSRGPINGQHALDVSIKIKDTSPRRVGIDYETGEFVVFDKTRNNVYHGHVRTWDQLHPDMQRVLREAKMVDSYGFFKLGV